MGPSLRKAQGGAGNGPLMVFMVCISGFPMVTKSNMVAHQGLRTGKLYSSCLAIFNSLGHFVKINICRKMSKFYGCATINKKLILSSKSGFHR